MSILNESKQEELDNMLVSMLIHAKASVPYYRERYPCEQVLKSMNVFELRNIPLLSKKTVCNRPRDFISYHFSKTELISESTSGTTGECLTVYKSTKERVEADLLLWKYRRAIRGDIASLPIAKFYGYRDGSINSPKQSVIQENGNLLFPMAKLSNQIFQDYYKAIKAVNPIWMFGPPSVIYRFARYLQNNLLIIPKNMVVYIELTGELVDSEQKKIITEVFKCPVRNHYGTREFWAIALECEYGNLHVLENRVHLEVIDKNNNPLSDNTSGELLATGLRTFSMPLIRYRIGDIATIPKYQCSCGQKGNLLSLQGCRTTEYIISPNGYEISPIVLFSAISQARKMGLNVSQFQMVQTTATELFVRLVSETQKDYKKLIPVVREAINSMVPEMKVRFELCHEIELESTKGKFRYFWNVYKPS